MCRGAMQALQVTTGEVMSLAAPAETGWRVDGGMMAAGVDMTARGAVREPAVPLVCPEAHRMTYVGLAVGTQIEAGGCWKKQLQGTPRAELRARTDLACQGALNLIPLFWGVLLPCGSSSLITTVSPCHHRSIKEMAEAKEAPSTPAYDATVDFFSPQFDAAKALSTPGLPPPNPKVSQENRLMPCP